MGAYVLLNLLNKLRKGDKTLSILFLFGGAQFLDMIYHITLKLF